MFETHELYLQTQRKRTHAGALRRKQDLNLKLPRLPIRSSPLLRPHFGCGGFQKSGALTCQNQGSNIDPNWEGSYHTDTHKKHLNF